MGSDEVGVIWKPECKNKVTFRVCFDACSLNKNYYVAL